MRVWAFAITFLLLSISSVHALAPGAYCGVTIDNPQWEAKTSGGSSVVVVDKDGDTYIRSTTVTQSSGTITTASNSFIIQTVSAIKGLFNTANAKLTGTISTGQTGLTAGTAAFVVKNTAGTVLAKVDSSGNLLVRGAIAYNGIQSSCPGDGWYCNGAQTENRDYTCNGPTGQCDYTFSNGQYCSGTYCSGGQQGQYTGCSGGACTGGIIDSCWSCSDTDTEPLATSTASGKNGCSGGGCTTYSLTDSCINSNTKTDYKCGGSPYTSSTVTCTNKCIGSLTHNYYAQNSIIRYEPTCVGNGDCSKSTSTDFCNTNPGFTNYVNDYACLPSGGNEWVERPCDQGVSCSGSTLTYENGCSNGACTTTTRLCNGAWCSGNTAVTETGCSGSACTTSSTACATTGAYCSGAQIWNNNGCSNGACVGAYSGTTCSTTGSYCSGAEIRNNAGCSGGACTSTSGGTCATTGTFCGGDNNVYNYAGCSNGGCIGTLAQTCATSGSYCSGNEIRNNNGCSGGACSSTSGGTCATTGSFCGGDGNQYNYAGCSNGGCIGTFAQTCYDDCSDTDGGFSVGTQGTSTWRNGCSGSGCQGPWQYTDWCSGNTLKEYWCSGGNTVISDYNCVANGFASCSVGKCNP